MKNSIDDNLKTIPLPEEQFDLIDGATGQISDVVKEIEELYKVAKNKDNTLVERMEAYEDIIDSEVGDTSLWRARNIEREVGLRQIYLKFEGSNPSGTQKDRIAFAQSLDALRRGFDTITVATCGNYGVAVALAASFAGLRCVIYLPENYHTKRIKEMTDLNAEIIRVPGDYEKAVEYSQQQAQRLEYYDANPGGVNTSLQLSAYGTIATEIYDELSDAPKVVAVPVSNGSTLAGVFKGFLSLYRRGKTSKLPKMVAGSSFNKNPVIQAYLNNYRSCIDLRPEKIHETKINEPLINWHSIDGDLALYAIRTSGGWVANASDKKMVAFSKMILEKEGMNVLPASTAGLIALIDHHQKEQLPNDRYVVILTGKRS